MSDCYLSKSRQGRVAIATPGMALRKVCVRDSGRQSCGVSRTQNPLRTRFEQCSKNQVAYTNRVRKIKSRTQIAYANRTQICSKNSIDILRVEYTKSSRVRKNRVEYANCLRKSRTQIAPSKIAPSQIQIEYANRESRTQIAPGSIRFCVHDSICVRDFAYAIFEKPAEIRHRKS